MLACLSITSRQIARKPGFPVAFKVGHGTFPTSRTRSKSMRASQRRAQSQIGVPLCIPHRRGNQNPRARAVTGRGESTATPSPDLLAVAAARARANLLALVDAQDDYRRDMAQLTGGEVPPKRTLKALRQMARGNFARYQQIPRSLCQWLDAAKRTDNPAGDLRRRPARRFIFTPKPGGRCPTHFSARQSANISKLHGACHGAVQAVQKWWKKY